ncbi:alpha-D-ribose 1-methylphosphonate 5-triphosphate diphosphatase [Laribacter hongkongensis]|uniref:alpha-D-ribose 1-methylphosphonate 5-triphosphate diphosphatase n=1 Tax=Laribacter hongkongensis TaxID=168471 RepID=UPI001EFD682E|nr:alpha-D-ribose 1-methylphosphonate 5-triphosphate diphosphatase [Laribacter hongkongensis]MCG9058703.1 alpha-D-ribose 1-methylphosphonate 5-triphosphate diphosphatase [Laribacter hongkongensis]MCG9084600.1 alpha-D-ribose 1-methylphosphonate 5-triphosphate diphosphatase [Laribacter hongkongensis]
MSQLFNHARLILADRVIERGALETVNGMITAIHEQPLPAGCGLDLGGDDLIPGLVEVHTDNLEKHLMPRNGVLWPMLPAVITHDAQCVAAGITTVLDALSVGDLEGESVRLETLHTAFAAINAGQEAGVFRADHLIHLRCELAYPDLLAELAPLIDHPAVRLVSVMDHTPGQRQYRDLAQYKKYYAKKKVNWTDDTFEAAVAERRAMQARYSATHNAAVVEMAQARRIALASHDDTDPAHIKQACRDGVVISEFPTTRAAAAAAHEAGLWTVMGAPNVVRGGSHSGNVAAVELARAGLLDILSSDYVPASLLHAAYLLQEQAGWTLPAAIATVSRTPARAIGLADRGEIAVGQRADLVRVRAHADTPLVQGVWKQGRQVF